MLEGRAAHLGKRAPVSLRVNPDVDAKTHPYIATGLAKAKFGIAWGDAITAYERARALPHLDVIGIDCHIGSQLESAAPFIEALDKLLDLTVELRARGFQIRHLDIGGGLGIVYREESPPSPRDYVTAVKRQLSKRQVGDLEIITEPGRVIVGNAAVLLSRVTLTKDNGETRFVVLDAGMNDLIRPALYEAYHHIEPVLEPRSSRRAVDVVGPVCETGDAFAKGRDLPELLAGELVVLRSAGAYGMVMASNYNSRPRPAEVLVEGDTYRVIRRRENFEDLVAHEVALSE
jgi:diaminopimelate decarboxylase